MLLTILQDAMSRIATIVFAQRFGLRIEPDAKRYRFLADLFNDTAFFIELYSPQLGAVGKMVALSTSQALRALCGVAAGASKAALSVHFAKHDNLAELNAKEASQETAVGLVGLLVGTVVVKYIESHRSVVLLMAALVLGHLWVNYLGVCSVHMTTLNRQRATIFFKEYLKTGKVLNPSEVALRENILFWDSRTRNQEGQPVARIEFAESYKHALEGMHSTKVIDGRQQTHILSAPTHGGGLSTIKILLHDSSEPLTAVQAWFFAMEVCWHMEKNGEFTRELEKPEARDMVSAKAELYEKMEAFGWNLDAQAFETGAPVRIRIQPGTRKDI